MERLRRLGLQRRIMLYVAAGLVLLFGVLAFVGLGSIDEATQLVFQERLTTAFTTAGILDRDFVRVASETGETAATLAPPGGGTTDLAEPLLQHFTRVGGYPFFTVSGIWVFAADGRLLDAAGNPTPPSDPSSAAATVLAAVGQDHAILRAFGPVPGAVSFAAVAVRLGFSAAHGEVVVVHTVSKNSHQSFVPAVFGRPGSDLASPPPAASEAYHLEVVDPDGIAILGIGQDEHPGTLSTHFAAIRGLMATHGAAALLHEPGPGQTFEPHVMAVVPLAASPFYLVIEQPVDVALALPLELRQRLLVLTVLGFLATLAVAWVTTRHVVKPTEELTAAAGRIAAGDLSSPITVKAEDEIATLADNLEAMRRRLQAAYEQAEQTNRQLEARVAERTARLGQLLRTTINAQEEERHRLARELHDETAQTLAALSIALDRARDGLTVDPGDREAADGRLALERIQEARAIAKRLLAETRRLILGLRPAMLDDLGLVSAIRWHCEHTFDQSKVAVSVDAEPLGRRLPGHVEVALFRIAQEAVSNAHRHADAQHLWVQLRRYDGRIRLAVRDDGRGFDVQRAMGSTASSSVGLLGMQERVRILNGTMEIHSAAQSGTEVVVEVPVSGNGR